MRLRILIQRREDNWQDHRYVLPHEIDNVLVVPIIERTLSNLNEMSIYDHASSASRTYLKVLAVDAA